MYRVCRRGRPIGRSVVRGTSAPVAIGSHARSGEARRLQPRGTGAACIKSRFSRLTAGPPLVTGFWGCGSSARERGNVLRVRCKSTEACHGTLRLHHRRVVSTAPASRGTHLWRRVALSPSFLDASSRRFTPARRFCFLRCCGDAVSRAYFYRSSRSRCRALQVLCLVRACASTRQLN